MSQLICLTGPPLSGKDHVAGALCHLLDSMHYRILRAGRVFRKYLGVKVFIEDEGSHYGPEWADFAIRQMMRHAVTKYGHVICVGVPRTPRQVAYVADLQGVILFVSGHWARDQTEEEDQLTGLAADEVAKGDLFSRLRSMALNYQCPTFDIFNRFAIEVPDTSHAEIDLGELWRVVEPTLPSRVVAEADERSVQEGTSTDPEGGVLR